MNSKLAKSLFERSLFPNGTEILIPIKTQGIGKKVEASKPHIILQSKLNDNDNVFFACQGKEDGEIRIVPATDVEMIEGMGPERFAKVYNIKPDGTYKSPGKKRGRKPKNRVDAA